MGTVYRGECTEPCGRPVIVPLSFHDSGGDWLPDTHEAKTKDDEWVNIRQTAGLGKKPSRCAPVLAEASFGQANRIPSSILRLVGVRTASAKGERPRRPRRRSVRATGGSGSTSPFPPFRTDRQRPRQGRRRLPLTEASVPSAPDSTLLIPGNRPASGEAGTWGVHARFRPGGSGTPGHAPFAASPSRRRQQDPGRPAASERRELGRRRRRRRGSDPPPFAQGRGVSAGPAAGGSSRRRPRLRRDGAPG